MHHAMLVRLDEGIDHFGEQTHCFVDWKLPFAIEALAQRLPLDVGHDEEEEPVGFPGIEQRQDVWMLQLGSDLDFAQESSRTQGSGESGASYEGDSWRQGDMP